MPVSISLKVPKTSAQKAIMLTKELALLNSGLDMKRDTSFICIPLAREPFPLEGEKLRRTLPEFTIVQQDFEELQGKPVTLMNLLSGKLPPHALVSLPHAIDFVGDIAVVEVPPELEKYKRVIGDAILSAHNRVKTVLSKGGPVTGVYRLRTFEVIGGEAKTRTVHKEHGCVFFVDLAKAYFTPRLSYEHSRVASLVREGETVIDMFAGVGPFSIHIAKTHKRTHVYAIDANPDAYELLKKNIAVNRVLGKVAPVLGDARQIVNESLAGVADRVIMNLPERAIEYVDTACRALRPEGGIVHHYQFSNTSAPEETVKTVLANTVEHCDRHVRVLRTRIVRGVAPFTYQVVVDAGIK